MSVEALFKYGHFGEHSEQLFSTPTMWFSSPAALNDPFECRPWFTFEGSDDQFLSVFRTIAKRHFPSYTDSQLEAEAQRLLNDGRHRDPRFFATFRADVVRMVTQRIGICCFSRRRDNILMWSHYARDHQGFCLEFEATDTTPFFGEAQEVKYAHSFPVVDFFNTPHDVQVDLIFLTKFAGWEYEEEYRVVDHQQGPGLHRYSVELLKSVTFGLRTSDADKRRFVAGYTNAARTCACTKPLLMSATSRSFLGKPGDA